MNENYKVNINGKEVILSENKNYKIIEGKLYEIEAEVKARIGKPIISLKEV